MADLERVEQNELIYFKEPDSLAEKGLLWAAFGRQGGRSKAEFASLNVGYHVGDDAWRVTANRQLIAGTLSIPLDHLVAAQQAHGVGVAVVDQGYRGKGAGDWAGALPQTDALVTKARQTYLTIVVADCAVLTFFDPVKRVVGTAHCGWRGMLAGLGPKTVSVMQQTFGCRPEDISLIVSPSIGPCCYEVGELVLAPLRQGFPGWRDFIALAGESSRLDLWEMARRQALDSGLVASSIHVAGLCTACHTDLLFSHRAEGGKTGRFAVLAGLR